MNNVGLSRKHIVEGVNASLERLGLDYVDLIYAHRPDRNTPIEETVRAFNHIIDTGKAFYWGTSEWDADEIATAWRVADKLGLSKILRFHLFPVSAHFRSLYSDSRTPRMFHDFRVMHFSTFPKRCKANSPFFPVGPLMEQPNYNMLVRDKVEKEFAHLYEEIGLGLTTFSPLKQGFLTGKYNEGIPSDSRLGSGSNDKFIQMMNKKVGDESWKKDIENVSKLKPIADKLEISQATLAYAWVLSNKNVSSAITGASKPEQVYESVKAFEAVEKLTPEILKEIDEVLGNKPAAFTRRFG